MIRRVLGQRAQEGVAAPVYQRAIRSMPASHRKLGVEFSKSWLYQTMCFDTCARGSLEELERLALGLGCVGKQISVVSSLSHPGNADCFKSSNIFPMKRASVLRRQEPPISTAEAMALPRCFASCSGLFDHTLARSGVSAVSVGPCELQVRFRPL